MEINAVKVTEKKRVEENPQFAVEEPNELDEFEKRLNQLK